MKQIFFLLALAISLPVCAVNTSYESFNTNSFKITGTGIGSIDIIPSLLWSNMVFVDTGKGNDSKGVRGNPNKPFATITVAQSVVQAGDTMVIQSGSYNAEFATNAMIGYYLQSGTLVQFDFRKQRTHVSPINIKGDGTVSNIFMPNLTDVKVQCQDLRGDINWDGGNTFNGGVWSGGTLNYSSTCHVHTVTGNFGVTSPTAQTDFKQAANIFASQSITQSWSVPLGTMSAPRMHLEAPDVYVQVLYDWRIGDGSFYGGNSLRNVGYTELNPFLGTETATLRFGRIIDSGSGFSISFPIQLDGIPTFNFDPSQSSPSINGAYRVDTDAH